MMRLFHHACRLSMVAVGAAGSIALAAPAVAGEAAASPYFGRWTVSEERPVFTARGREYKTIDIAPCGRDFCGVSVSDAGACGPALFRFLMKHADGEGELHGHGRWGAAKKNVQIYTWQDEAAQGGKGMQLYLGDGYDFGERSDNMPKFQAQYRPVGRASCTTR